MSSEFEQTKIDMQIALNEKRNNEINRLSNLSEKIKKDYDELLTRINYEENKGKIQDDMTGVHKLKYEKISYMISNKKCSICVIETWDLKEKYEEYKKIEDVSTVINKLNITKKILTDFDGVTISSNMSLEMKLRNINQRDVIEWRMMYKYVT